MLKKCPICGKDKEDVGPKLVGKGVSKDIRLGKENDVLLTKIMCQECYNRDRNNQIKAR